MCGLWMLQAKAGRWESMMFFCFFRKTKHVDQWRKRVGEKGRDTHWASFILKLCHLNLFKGDGFADYSMVNHHEKNIWENMFLLFPSMLCKSKWPSLQVWQFSWCDTAYMWGFSKKVGTQKKTFGCFIPSDMYSLSCYLWLVIGATYYFE